MSTQHTRSSMSRSFLLLVLTSFSTVACATAQVACPEGFTLSGAGRCIVVDAGAMPPGDGGPTSLGDGGHDAATLADAGTPTLDAATITNDDASVEARDAYVALPDAYVAPDACAWGTWYADADHDGYGNASMRMAACRQPMGTVTDATDCDDAMASVHPGAAETCNAIDDNCNRSVDEGVTLTFYYDGDGDTYGTAATTTTGCTPPGHYVAVGGDCNDAASTIHPGATETCDFRDEDCDGIVDNGVGTPYYADCDGDGYAAAGALPTLACPRAPPRTAPTCAGGAWTTFAPVTGYIDCADGQPLAYPGSRHFDVLPVFRTAGGGGSWDWNCDSIQLQRVTTITGTTASCGFGTLPGTCGVSGESWAGVSRAPDCGTFGNLHTCTSRFDSPACSATTVTSQQACN